MRTRPPELMHTPWAAGLEVDSLLPWGTMLKPSHVPSTSPQRLKMMRTPPLLRVTSVLVEASVRCNTGSALVQVAEQMAAGSTSFYDATIELAQVLYRISLAQIVPDALPEDWQLSKMVRELAPQMGADEVQLYYSIVTQAREQLHLAPDPQAGFTMMLLRLLAFVPEQFQADSAKK